MFVSYAEMRFQAGSTQRQVTIVPSRKPTSPSLDEELWQKLYKSLVLLKQDTQNEGFKMLNAACQLAKQFC